MRYGQNLWARSSSSRSARRLATMSKMSLETFSSVCGHANVEIQREKARRNKVADESFLSNDGRRTLVPPT